MWIKKLLLLIVLIVLMFTLNSARETREAATFPMNHLTNPDSVIVDNHHIYISEGTTVYIFNKENLKLKKKFGQQGEGPQEFLLNVMQGAERLLMDVQGEELMINSLGKLSFFEKENGLFLREMKIPARVSEFKPLGKYLTAQTMLVDNGVQFRAIHLYDKKINKIKEIFRMKHHFQFSKRELKVGEKTFQSSTYEGKLYIAWEDDFIIRVYNKEGDPVQVIHPEYQRVKVTSEYQDKIINYLKTNKKYRDFLEQVQPKIVFPEYFSAITNMIISDQTIYAFTFREKNNQNECVVLDGKGNPKQILYLTIKVPGNLLPTPFSIKNNKLYQLIEKDERWELAISEIK